MSKAKKPTKTASKYPKDRLQDMLGCNDKAVCRAVVAIYKRQTAHEQSADQTKETNGIGFTGPDAPLMSKFAKQLLTVGYLSPRQTDIARGRMRKYWRQLAEIAEQNDAIKAGRIAEAQRQEDRKILLQAQAYQRSFKFDAQGELA